MRATKNRIVPVAARAVVLLCAGAPVAAWAAVLLCAGAPSASAADRCARGGERVLASSPRLILLAPRRDAGGVRIVCRRDSGKRRTLAPAACSHCAARIGRVLLHGRFAHAVLSRRTFNDQEAELVTLDTHTWRTRRASLDLGDQNDVLRSEVTDVIAAPHGRVVLRVRNDFAAGIVLVDGDEAAWLDEGLATAVGRPQVRGRRVVWRHGVSTRSASTLPEDRCPQAPAPRRELVGGRYSRILGTADAVTSGRWYCVRATGSVGRLDGAVGRLVGPLAVVQRPDDVRVVDLRTATTIAGPVSSSAMARSGATVGPSGTLVLRRPSGCAGDAEIVAIAPGAPERRIACGDLRDLRYEDGLVRYRDHATGTAFTVALP